LHQIYIAATILFLEQRSSRLENRSLSYYEYETSGKTQKLRQQMYRNQRERSE